MAITSAHRTPDVAGERPGAPRRSGPRVSRARPPKAAPASAPPPAEARTWAAAVSHHRFRRTRSPSGWMLASIDSPHGDQAERTPAISATATATPGIKCRSVARVGTAHVAGADAGMVQARVARQDAGRGQFVVDPLLAR